MNVKELIPSVTHSGRIWPGQENFAHEGSGCYVITDFIGDILFIGTGANIRDSIILTLSSLEKPASVSYQNPGFFHWRLAMDPVALERVWLKRHTLAEGFLPVLNRGFST